MTRLWPRRTHEASLTKPTKVLQIELNDSSALLPSFASLDPDMYAGVQALVRLNRLPLGYAWFKLQPGQPLPDPVQIQLDIVQQMQRPLIQAVLRQALEELAGWGPEDEWPGLTVVVPTRNRAASLKRTLHSLEKLDYPADKLDVLVVDNAPSDDSTRHVVAQFSRCCYVREPRPGLEWARNRGLHEATRELVAYIDDDVVVDPDWARSLTHAFAHPVVMGVTGLVAPASLDSEAQNLFEEFGGFGKGFERRYYSTAIDHTWPFPLNSGRVGTGANMAFRKAALLEVGGFDPVLGAGSPVNSGGDLDILYRLLRKSYSLVYEPRALVWHYHRKDFGSLSRQLRNYGSGLYALFLKSYMTDPSMRRRAFVFGLWWFGRHYLWHCLTKRGIRRQLALVQIAGILAAPWRYIRSVRRYHRMVDESRDLVGVVGTNEPSHGR